MSTLGVLIFSLRGMKHLAQCLESVEWADAVAILHLGDGEPFIRTGPGPSPLIRKVALTEELRGLRHELPTDWLLHLWGEERVEAPLQEELKELRRAELTHAPLSYRIPVRSRLLGRWVNGSLWGPTPALRLSRDAKRYSPGWWDSPETTERGTAGLLKGWLGDYSLAEMSKGLDPLNAISDLWAQQLQAKGRRPGSSDMILEPFRVFLRLFVMKGGFSKGLVGLTLSVLAAYAVFLGGAKAWEENYVKSTKTIE